MACYTQALKLLPKDEKDKEKLKDRGVILKNRAACYLKLVSNIIIITVEPINSVTSGPQKSGHINGIALLRGLLEEYD